MVPEAIALINAMLMLTIRNIYLLMGSCGIYYVIYIVDPEPIKGSRE
jgi:hypothetical protein